MRYIKIRYHVFRLLGVVLIFLIILLITNFIKNQNENQPEFSTEKLRDSLRTQLANNHSSSVYTKVISDFENEHYISQHNAAHIFGEELYKSKGAAGISTCDNNYGYGCFHGFFIKAIEDKGVAVIKILNQECIEKYRQNSTPCQHGIGHGIIEFTGTKNINKALFLCEAIQFNPLLGCSSGVFMGYNFPRSENTFEEFPIRPLDDKNYYKSCQSVANKFRKSCYYEITDLWMLTLGTSSKKPKKLCLDLADAEERKACIKGLGKAVARFSDYQMKDIQTFCTSLSGDQERLHCLSGAMWGLLSQKEYFNTASDLCHYSNNIDQCLKEGDLRNETW